MNATEVRDFRSRLRARCYSCGVVDVTGWKEQGIERWPVFACGHWGGYCMCDNCTTESDPPLRCRWADDCYRLDEDDDDA